MWFNVEGVCFNVVCAPVVNAGQSSPRQKSGEGGGATAAAAVKAAKTQKAAAAAAVRMCDTGLLLAVDNVKGEQTLKEGG